MLFKLKVIDKDNKYDTCYYLADSFDNALNIAENKINKLMEHGFDIVKFNLKDITPCLLNTNTK